MRCALVNSLSFVVENLIEADPQVDPAPPGYWIIGIGDESPVSFGWIYDANTQTFSPPVEQ